MTANVPSRTIEEPKPLRVLVTGVTGYIGGRLTTRLLATGHQLRCIARKPGRIELHRWPGVEIMQADLEDSEAPERVLQNVDVAYYLVHSMASGEAFWERDRLIALAFGAAAAKAGVRRIIYIALAGSLGIVLLEDWATLNKCAASISYPGMRWAVAWPPMGCRWSSFAPP